MKEQMRADFEAIMRERSTSELKINRFGNYQNTTIQTKWKYFEYGYQAALSAVPANHVGDSNEMVQSQAQQESKWISVEEAKATLKDGDLLFAYCEFYGVVEATYAFEEGYYNPHRIVKNNGDSYRINTFTHFMARKPESLPPAPEGDKK